MVLNRDFFSFRCIRAVFTSDIGSIARMLTSCRFFGVFYFTMSCRREFFIRGITTTFPFAGYVRVPAFFRTGYGFTFMRFFIVTERRDFHASGVSTIFSFTCFMRIPAVFRASGFFCFVGFYVMRKRVYIFRIGCRFANRASEGFYAFFRTGRLSGNFTIIPSVFARCRDF